MLLFNYAGSNKSLIEATNLANEIFGEVISELKKEKFYLADSHCNFDQNITSVDLANSLEVLCPEIKMEIKEYRYYSSKVLGYYSSYKPNNIHINTNSLPRRVYSLTATFYHELGHKIDSLIPLKDLAHGKGITANYYRKWKESTCPYYLDGIAEKVAKRRLGIVGEGRTNNSNYIYVPWWKKVLTFWRYI